MSIGTICSENKFDIFFQFMQTYLIRVTVEDETLEATSSLLEDKIYYDLVDFDNHLDNISLDWKNLSLNKQIEGILSDIKSKKS